MKSRGVTRRVKTSIRQLTRQLQIQKGVLQLCKGLSFLHTSARTIHSNINPENILINNAVSAVLKPQIDASQVTYREIGNSVALVSPSPSNGQMVP
jgi:serine/threonine protein kinase